jgi:hypothetical protein
VHNSQLLHPAWRATCERQTDFLSHIFLFRANLGLRLPGVIATIFLNQDRFLCGASALFPIDEGDFTAPFNPGLDGG